MIYFQNTAIHQPPATCHVDHNKCADQPPVGRGTRTRLSAPFPYQSWHLLTNTISKIAIGYCSVCCRGSPLSSMVSPPRHWSSMRRERLRPGKYPRLWESPPQINQHAMPTFLNVGFTQDCRVVRDLWTTAQFIARNGVRVQRHGSSFYVV